MLYAIIFCIVLSVSYVLYLWIKRRGFMRGGFKKGDQLVILSSDPKTVHKVKRVKGNIIDLE
jgi:hypothetical protein